VAGEGLHGGAEAERPDEVRDLDERAERLGRRRGVPQRGEQVRLPDAEAAVEVQAGAARGRGAPEPAAPPRRVQPVGERGGGGDRGGLGRLGGVRPVGAEPDVGEARRRHQVGHQPVRCDPRRAVDEAFLHDGPA
jgi:hypothetical protein